MDQASCLRRTRVGGDLRVSTSRYILGPEYRSLLASFARRRLLVALDFDGVLAPVVSTPEAARVPAVTKRLAFRVATLYPSVVISGRWRSQLVDRLPEVPFARLIGNFGYQPRDHAGHPEVKALGAPVGGHFDRGVRRPRRHDRGQAVLAGGALPPRAQPSRGTRADPEGRTDAGGCALVERHAGHLGPARDRDRTRVRHCSRRARGSAAIARSTLVTTTPTRTRSPPTRPIG